MNKEAMMVEQALCIDTRYPRSISISNISNYGIENLAYRQRRNAENLFFIGICGRSCPAGFRNVPNSFISRALIYDDIDCTTEAIPLSDSL